MNSACGNVKDHMVTYIRLEKGCCSNPERTISGTWSLKKSRVESSNRQN